MENEVSATISGKQVFASGTLLLRGGTPFSLFYKGAEIRCELKYGSGGAEVISSAAGGVVSVDLTNYGSTEGLMATIDVGEDDGKLVKLRLCGISGDSSEPLDLILHYMFLEG